jgi:hypothetical protein
MKKMTGTTGGHFLPLTLEFIVLGGSLVPEDLGGANNVYE